MYKKFDLVKIVEAKKKVALVCCSNGRRLEEKKNIQKLVSILNGMGIEVTMSKYLYAKDLFFSGTAVERASALMQFFLDDTIDAIFDISGGDISNEILSYINFDIIKEHYKPFYGYSDLTVIINSIYQMTNKGATLYQVFNIEKDNSSTQAKLFKDSFVGGDRELYKFDYDFVNGRELKGIVVGGNIRCLLKLAGTKYWPDMNGKILFLESRSGNVDRITSYLSQLKQMNVFDVVNGIILGTFTEIESLHNKSIVNMLLAQLERDIPVVKTNQIGHAIDSKAIEIGSYINLK